MLYRGWSVCYGYSHMLGIFIRSTLMRCFRGTLLRCCWWLPECMFCEDITKTYLYNFDPLKPHFYIVKLGFTGVYIIFLISSQKHRLWVLIRTAYPQSMFWAEILLISEFLSENFQFLVVKFSIYLRYRRVFVMNKKNLSTLWMKKWLIGS